MNYKSVKNMKMNVQGMGLRVLLLVTIMVWGVACQDDDPATPPVISGFTPTTGGLPGSTATIAGNNFSATPTGNAVQFNGVPATVSAASATQLTVTVPQATTGKITVTVNGMTATSADDFIMLIPAPAITGFAPATGRAGTPITITGTHFSKTLAENSVNFNGVAATVTQASETSITVKTPDGALSGKITITVNGQAATSTGHFEAIHTVYAAGHSSNANTTNIQVAEYWKDGELTSLTDETGNSYVTAIDVVGQDVYLAGALGDTEGLYAAYWKNGVPVKLTDKTTYSLAKAIDVVGNDVYVAGTEGNAAVYWKNNVPTYLTDGELEAEVEGMAISGSDIYVIGYQEEMGKYWKNGVAVELGQSVYPYAISVSGSDVHIAYFKGNAAYYWKNGVAQKISGENEAAPWDMAVSGSDIHIVGRDGTKAAYWKNGTAIPLEGGIDANAIFILGEDVYIAGTDSSNRAKYWKNGVAVNLTAEVSGVYATALAITVK